MTDSRVGQINYLGKILKIDIVQDQPRPHGAFSLGRMENAPQKS